MAKNKPLPWLRLDDNNTPPFKEQVLVMNAKDESWDKLYLSEISKTAEGNKYTFRDTEGNAYDEYTHYLIITPPEN